MDTTFQNGTVIEASWLQDVNDLVYDIQQPGGAALVPFKHSTTATQRTVDDKLKDVASIKDYGAVGDGVVDDTAAINAAIAANAHVVVPAGMTPLISSTINVPSGKKLEFLGGLGNTSGAYPASYFIKKSTMTTPGITVSERGWVHGGGLYCQSGNTGDGIQLLANSATVTYFLVHGAGSDGVRVGVNAGSNANSFLLDHVTSQYNGGRGFYIHDGKTGVGADANAGTLRQCFSHHNGVDGFSLGHCFWVLLDNCLSENNGGWGLYLDDTDDGLGYPSCRYATVLGGDYNESNALGVIYDRSYRSTFINPDPFNIPTNTGGALPGSGQRSVFTTFGTTFFGGTTYTLQGTQPFTVNDGGAASLTYGQVMYKQTTGTNGHGTGLRVDLNNGTTTFTGAGGFNVQQLAANKWGTVLLAHNGTSSIQVALTDGATNAFRPGAHNTYYCGISGGAWAGGYTQVAFTVVSDQREKQQIASLEDKEIAVGKELKTLIKRFKLNSEVETLGDGAEIHFGVIAQEVEAVFTKHGLNADDYAVFKRGDTEHGERLGVNYEQILCLVLGSI